MKLAPRGRQQGDGQGGIWGGQARAEHRTEATAASFDSSESEPVGMVAASRDDDPYRGMSDGEMLEF